jgi:DNA-directed RNA polymerase II subunit RPB11
MNAPEKYTTWRWEDEDQAKKLTFIEDTKMPNAGLFVLGKEDHTMGNLIRMQLLRDSSVRFAGSITVPLFPRPNYLNTNFSSIIPPSLGYRMPHPLIYDCHIKVQTTDSRTTPVKVFLAALNDLSVETSTLEKNFEVTILSSSADVAHLSPPPLPEP